MSLDPQQVVVPPQMGPEDPVATSQMVEAPVLRMLASAELCAKKAGAETNAAEAKDWAAAALNLAQAVITLDPARLAAGDTPQGRQASVPSLRDTDRDGKVAEER